MVVVVVVVQTGYFLYCVQSGCTGIYAVTMLDVIMMPTSCKYSLTTGDQYIAEKQNCKKTDKIFIKPYILYRNPDNKLILYTNGVVGKDPACPKLTVRVA